MSLKIPFSGGCACGAIRYQATGDPILSLNCHCRDCQHASGSAYASLIVLSTEDVEMSGEEPKYHAKISDGGNEVRRGFCADCGSPVTLLEPDRPKLVFLQAGSLDDPSNHEPTMDIFIASAHPWDTLDPQLEKFPGMPPVPDSLGR